MAAKSIALRNQGAVHVEDDAPEARCGGSLRCIFLYSDFPAKRAELRQSSKARRADVNQDNPLAA